MASGTVKWFNDASDYGFIVRDDDAAELYVRGSSIDAEAGTRLTAGDKVEFEERVAGMGPEAIAVLPVQLRADLRCGCGYGIVAGGRVDQDARHLPAGFSSDVQALPERRGAVTAVERQSAHQQM